MLEMELGGHSCADIFASRHENQGFPTHYDAEEMFVGQLIGTKHWRLMKPERLHPTQDDKRHTGSFKPPMQPSWEGDVNPGDLLYVPGGWWHDTLALSSKTLHVSLSIFPPTGLTILRDVLQALEDDELTRKPLPRFASEVEQEEYMSRLRKAVDAKLRDVAVKSFLEKLDHVAAGRSRLSLPWNWVLDVDAIPADAWIHWLAPRPITLREEVGQCTFEIIGTRFAFARP